MMLRIFSLIFLAMISMPNVQAQDFTDLSLEIPFDKEFRTGVLPNGLTYYIRHNKNPEGKASFYIYQNVGAVLENDEQNGLAHFLEHMAFNGTSTFPGKSMLNYLEKKGVKFGKDVNAYTTQNETVYNISRVPLDQGQVIDSCLLILRDWSNELTLETAEIDAERGVIAEEWRTRHNSASRIRKQTGSVVYNGTIYADRDVIGDMEVIRNFDPKDLREFYHDWYRTDLQAVAIVGDIDAEEVEKKVIALFSEVPAVQIAKERTEISIPDHADTKYVVATDREVNDVNISLSFRHKSQFDNTLGDLRQNYVTSFFNSLVNNRLRELKQRGETPFLSGGIGLSELVRGYKTFNVKATAKPEKMEEAFEAVYTELERVLRYGFTEGELERLKTNSLASAERIYKKRSETETETYCKLVKSAYLKNTSIPDADFSYEFTKAIVPSITKQEVAAIAKQYLAEINRVFVIVGPEKTSTPFLTQKELEAIITRVQASDIKPYSEEMEEGITLMTKTPEAGTIVSEKALPEFGAVEWTLSNGAKVVYRFADFQKGTVSLSAVSDGGASLYPAEDLPSIGAVTGFVRGFGIGEHDPIEYKKLMTGKSANSNFEIGSLNEKISAASSTEDIETMMQLVFMRFEAPRFDQDRFQLLMKQNYEKLDQKVKTANSMIKDTLQAIMRNGNPRSINLDKAYLDAIDFERMKEIYHERFSDASDFTFFIVGDVGREVLQPLVELYIGSLPGNGTAENWKDHGNYFPKGKQVHQIEVPMVEPKATVILKMRAAEAYTRKSVIYQTILAEVLKLRFTENIREKEGGTYGVNVSAGATRIPGESLSLDIHFDCDPDKAEYLKKLVYRELEVIKRNVKQEDLDKVVLNMKKNTEGQQKKNVFWMKALMIFYDQGENILDPAYFDSIVDEVTPEDVQGAARSFFKKADVVDLVFKPQEMNP